jgi:predicted peptidase
MLARVHRHAGLVSPPHFADALPVGLRVSAIAVGTPVGSARPRSPCLRSSSRRWAHRRRPCKRPRTITKAYTSDTAATSNRASAGRYVILELAPADKNSAGSSNAAILTLQDSHSVRQVTPMTVNRQTIATSVAPTVNIAVARLIVDDFAGDTYTGPNGVSLDYRLFTPAAARAGQDNRRFPLVLHAGRVPTGFCQSCPLAASR